MNNDGFHGGKFDRNMQKECAVFHKSDLKAASGPYIENMKLSVDAAS